MDFSRVSCRDFAEQQNLERLKICQDGSDFDDFFDQTDRIDPDLFCKFNNDCMLPYKKDRETQNLSIF